MVHNDRVIYEVSMKKLIILGILCLSVLFANGCSSADKMEEVKRFTQEDVYGREVELSTWLTEDERLDLLAKMEQASSDMLDFSDSLVEIYRNPEKNLVLYKYEVPEADNGNGVLWFNNELQTISIFPEVVYGKAQSVSYDESKDCFFFSGDMMSGTGVGIDVLYVFDNLPNGSVELVYSISPNSIINVINESIDIKFDSVKDELVYYNNNKKIGVSKLPDFITQEEFLGIYIGNIVHYDLDQGNVIIEFDPGYKYESISDFVYDNSPRIQGKVEIKNNDDLYSYQISEIEFKK